MALKGEHISDEICSFCNSDEPKSGLARNLGDRIQSRNVPLALPVTYEIKI